MKDDAHVAYLEAEVSRLADEVQRLTERVAIADAGDIGHVVTFDYHAVTVPPFGVWRQVGQHLEVMVHGSDITGTLRVRERQSPTQRDPGEVAPQVDKPHGAPFVTESGENR